MRIYQTAIRLYIGNAWHQPLLPGLVNVGVDFYRAIPKSCPKGPVRRAAWLQLHIGMRPDWDNYYKAAVDALQGCILGDDSRNLGPGSLGGVKYYDLVGSGFTVVRIREVG